MLLIRSRWVIMPGSGSTDYFVGCGVRLRLVNEAALILVFKS
jgi:hypothetical protein